MYKTPPDTKDEFWYMGSFHERLTLEELHKRLLTFEQAVAALEKAEWERDPRVIAEAAQAQEKPNG